MKVLAQIVADDVTQVYDDVEALCNRISVSQHPELHTRLVEAMNVLFQARLLADEAAASTV